MEALFAFLVASFFAGVLSGLLGWRDPGRAGTWPTALFLFLVLFLAAWAGGVWLTPIGPPMWHARWVPFLLMGTFIALFLLAMWRPIKQPRTSKQAVEQAKEARDANVIFGIFFWAFLLCLVAAIAVRYVSPMWIRTAP